MYSSNIYRRRQAFLITLFAIAAFGLGIGFAAFSTTLNISSSATVSPNSSDFAVRFIDSSIMASAGGSGLVEPYASEGASGSSVYVNETYIKDLSVNFTGDGQYVAYEFWVANFGKFDAYLKEIKFSNVEGKDSNKICTPVGDTSASLVSVACDNIYIEIYVEDAFANTSTLYKNKKLEVDAYQSVYLEVKHSDEGVLADGPFTVEFGDIEFVYSTVDNESRVINFSYSDQNVSYELSAELGMTWEEWVESEYNTIGAYSQCNSIVLYDSVIIDGSRPEREIAAGYTYGPGRLLC
ncbi:MAG: hypothetical protein J6C28_00730 [Bacilli bacterium]|nr:hypothetical protein [Bacilli bacterium]